MVLLKVWADAETRFEWNCGRVFGSPFSAKDAKNAKGAKRKNLKKNFLAVLALLASLAQIRSAFVAVALIAAEPGLRVSVPPW
ncbi:MAG TPA: hypothetical protein VFW23_16235 [Tepidisphaeraceae bacterium]|nr:hypothetical protein [Tepidisphaeraceae bacterium]